MSRYQAQGKNWVFTINNPTFTDAPEEAMKGDYKYLIYQHEQGEKGTIHYQGYVMFKSNKRLAALKKYHGHAHWELRKGSHQQAKDYCSKEETRVNGPFEFGEAPAQGKRTDLDEVKSTLDAGGNIQDVAEQHFTSFIKYERGIKSYMSLGSKPRDFKTQVFVCYGPTGTGKTMYCTNMAPDAYWYYPQAEGKWWDGYHGQDDVIIDEFYGQIRWFSLLRLLDRYAMQVEVKGGTVNFAPKRIFITSNKFPAEWYDSAKYSFPTLQRRIEHFLYFPKFGQCFADMMRDAPPLPDDLNDWYTTLPKPEVIDDILNEGEEWPPATPHSPKEDEMLSMASLTEEVHNHLWSPSHPSKRWTNLYHTQSAVTSPKDF
ncbi:MAG: putative viral replication protein [Cressdnaviricota sp.]|nr:MAG: putative viral replication protein [Cressdnaviricota sp.]